MSKHKEKKRIKPFFLDLYFFKRGYACVCTLAAFMALGPENQGTVMFMKRKKKNFELSSTMLNETRDSSDETGD